MQTVINIYKTVLKLQGNLGRAFPPGKVPTMANHVEFSTVLDAPGPRTDHCCPAFILPFVALSCPLICHDRSGTRYETVLILHPSGLCLLLPFFPLMTSTSSSQFSQYISLIDVLPYFTSQSPAYMLYELSLRLWDHHSISTGYKKSCFSRLPSRPEMPCKVFINLLICRFS